MERGPLLLAFAAAFLLIFASGCAGGGQPPIGPSVNETPSPETPPSSNLTPNAPCSNGSILERDSCTLALAKASRNPSLCPKIYSVDQRDDCLLQFTGPDPSYCGSLTISKNKDTCIFGFANRTRDLELCLGISNDSVRAECTRLLAPACSGEPTDEGQARCLAFLYSDFTRCADDSCLYDFGVAKNSMDSCEIISNEPRRVACSAIVSRDDSSCAAIQENVSVNVCYGLAGIGLLSPETCEKAYSESVHQQDCIAAVALALRQPSICSRSGRQLGADNCYINLSLELGNYSLCENVQNSLLRPGCYNKFAIRFLMPFVCENLTRDMAQSCMTAIFNSPQITPSICPPISNPEWRDLCYYRNAKLSHNETICQSIGDENTQRNCIRESKII